MQSVPGRAVWRRLRRALALPFIFALFLPACREQTPIAGPIQPIAIAMKFSPGDTFTYTSWTLDQFDYPIPDSTHQERWRVMATGQTYRGLAGVVTILDSIGTGRYDTLHYAFSPAGDILQFGFVSALLGRVEGRFLTPQWDTIAAFSLGTNSFWPITGGDSTSDEKLFGSITGETEFFSVSVNGVTTVYPAYRVELTKSDIDIIFWATDSPTSFPGFREEPIAIPNGHLRVLASINSAQH